MVFKPTSIKILIYYDYNTHNLIIHFLRLHKVEIFKKSIFHLHVTHFGKVGHFVQIEIFFKTLLNLFSRWDF